MRVAAGAGGGRDPAITRILGLVAPLLIMVLFIVAVMSGSDLCTFAFVVAATIWVVWAVTKDRRGALLCISRG